MSTKLPSTVIDGAENTRPDPATRIECHSSVPLTAQKTRSELFGPCTAMLLVALLTAMDGPVAALAAGATAAASVRAAAAPGRPAASGGTQDCSSRSPFLLSFGYMKTALQAVPRRSMPGSFIRQNGLWCSPCCRLLGSAFLG